MGDLPRRASSAPGPADSGPRPTAGRRLGQTPPRRPRPRRPKPSRGCQHGTRAHPIGLHLPCLNLSVLRSRSRPPPGALHTQPPATIRHPSFACELSTLAIPRWTAVLGLCPLPPGQWPSVHWPLAVRIRGLWRPPNTPARASCRRVSTRCLYPSLGAYGRGRGDQRLVDDLDGRQRVRHVRYPESPATNPKRSPPAAAGRSRARRLSSPQRSRSAFPPYGPRSLWRDPDPERLPRLARDSRVDPRRLAPKELPSAPDAATSRRSANARCR